MQLVPGINRGRGKGGSVSYKQICAMEASLVSNRKSVWCTVMTVGIVTDSSEWLAQRGCCGDPSKSSFLPQSLCSLVSLAEEISQCTLPKVYNHGFCKWERSLWISLCTGGRSFLLLVNIMQLKHFEFGMQKPDSQVLEDELPWEQCRFT